jgi:PEP-CTERM motif
MCRAILVVRVWGLCFLAHHRSMVATFCWVGLAIILPGLPGPTTLANPIAGTATGDIAFDGGFGGGTDAASYSALPFAVDPPIQYTHTFFGDPADTNHSNAAFGGGYYFDSGLTAVILSSGSELRQYASGSPHTPATVTINWDATFRVDRWTNLTAHLDANIAGHIGENGFVAVDYKPFYNNYVTDSPVIHPGDPTSYANLSVIDYLDYFGNGVNSWAADLGGSAIVTRPNPPQAALDYIAQHPGIQRLTTPDGNYSVPAHFKTFIAPVIPSDFQGAFGYDQFDNPLPVYGYNRLWGSAEFVVLDPDDPTSLSFTLNPTVPEPTSLLLMAVGIGGLATVSAGRRGRTIVKEASDLGFALG